MPWWHYLLDVIGALLLVLILYTIVLVARRRFLARNGGTFEVSYRLHTGNSGSGWLLGLGRFRGESLEWFRIFSFSLRPKRVWDRRRLELVGRREPTAMERLALFADHTVVICHIDGDEVELAMNPASVTGFQAWLESPPPRSPSIV
mgnify:CR=1 FL=1